MCQPRIHLLYVTCNILFVWFVVSQPLRAAVVGHWRFESGGLLTDSGGNAAGPFGLTNIGTDNTNDAYLLPASGAGTAFPRTIPQTSQANAGAALFGASEATPDSFSVASQAAFNTGTFTIEALINMTSLAPASKERIIAGKYGAASGEKSWRFGVTGADASIPGVLILTVRGQNSLGTFESENYASAFPAIVPGRDYYAAVSLGVVAGKVTVTFYLKDLTTGAALLSSPRTVDMTSIFLSTAPFTIGNSPVTSGLGFDPYSPLSGS